MKVASGVVFTAGRQAEQRATLVSPVGGNSVCRAVKTATCAHGRVLRRILHVCYGREACDMGRGHISHLFCQSSMARKSARACRPQNGEAVMCSHERRVPEAWCSHAVKEVAAF